MATRAINNLGERKGNPTWFLVAMFLAPSLAFGYGAPLKIMRTSVDKMLRGTSGIEIVNGFSINKQLWLSQHFGLHGNAGIVIHSKHSFALHDLRIPSQIAGNPAHQQIFLNKATGIKGQIPTRTQGQMWESWDVVEIKAEKLITGVDNSYLRTRFRNVDLNRHRLDVTDIDDEIAFVLSPKEYKGNFGLGSVAVFTTTLSEMSGISPIDAHSIILAESQLWILEAPNELSPIGMQAWDSGRWYVIGLIDEILQHPSLDQPLEAMNDSLLPFLDYLARSGVNFSGTFSGLPADLFIFGAESLQGQVNFLLNDIQTTYSVVARSPKDILEAVSSNVHVPVQFGLQWVPDDDTAEPFIDADITVDKPLIEEGGSYGMLYRSHTVLAGGINKFSVGKGLQCAALVIYNDGGDAHSATLYGSEARPSTRSVENEGPQILFNDILGNRGYWTIETDGPCQVQIYTGGSLSLPDNNQTTRLEWPDDRGSPIYVYGQLDRNIRRNTYFITGRQGQAISGAAMPFSPVIGSNNYHVDIQLQTADHPFVTPIMATLSNPPTIPETYIQSCKLPRSSEFWEVTVTTDHTVKDLEYMLTITTGALDIQGVTEELSGVGIVGRVRE